MKTESDDQNVSIYDYAGLLSIIDENPKRCNKRYINLNPIIKILNS